jgi:hypothetical protein
MTMAILDSADDLLKKPSRRVLWDLSVADQKLKQLTTGILDDHDDLLRRGDNRVPSTQA